jgi:hypothetical protein
VLAGAASFPPSAARSLTTLRSMALGLCSGGLPQAIETSSELRGIKYLSIRRASFGVVRAARLSEV